MDSQKITAPSFHVNGLRNKYSYIHQTGNINIVGVSFYSFGLFPFIGKTLECIQNRIVDLHILSTKLEQKFKKAVSSDSISDIAENIEQILCSELQVDNRYISKANLINSYIEADDGIAIKIFCENYGVNIKTFERMVLQYTGYLPKALSKIKRFQNASNCLMHQNEINLSDLVNGKNQVGFALGTNFLAITVRLFYSPPKT